MTTHARTNLAYRRALGQRLGKARRATRMTQAAAARHLGVSRQAYNGWECGRNLPSVPHLAEICALLLADGHWLLTGQEREYYS